MNTQLPIMDTKITLSFEQTVIDSAKDFAERNKISLSRLTEYLYKKMTSGQYAAIEDLPISEWIQTISEGETEYHRGSATRKAKKQEFFESKK
jgi:Family of unknown function (DUF6364)